MRFSSLSRSRSWPTASTTRTTTASQQSLPASAARRETSGSSGPSRRPCAAGPRQSASAVHQRQRDFCHRRRDPARDGMHCRRSACSTSSFSSMPRKPTGSAGRSTRAGVRAFAQTQRGFHAGAGTATDTRRREALFHAGQETYIRKWFGPCGWWSYRLRRVSAPWLERLVLTGQPRAEAARRARLYVRGPRRCAGFTRAA